MPLLSMGQGQVGSPYTRFGLGDLNQKSFAPGSSRGGASYTFFGNNQLNFSNPASFAAPDSLTFNFDIGFAGGYRAYSTNDLSMGRSDMQLSHLAFGFPIAKWWGSAFTILPYSTRSYNIVSEDNSFDVSKNYIYYGSGGINQVVWGNGLAPFKNLHIGFNLIYYFGKLNQENALRFNDDTGSYLNVKEVHSVNISDFGFELGLQYNLKLSEDNSLIVGGVFSLDNKLNSRRFSLVTNSLASGGSAVIDTVYYSNEERGEISVPMSIGAGLGYKHSDKLTFAVDYTYQNWDNALFFGVPDSLTNSSRISAGLEWIPAGYSGSSLRYSQKINYRFGAYYENSYLNLSEMGGQINDFGISFGLGLPIKRSKSYFNIAMELGQRGTLDNSLIRERYAILSLNFSFSDIWFVKRKFD